jgi:hypothetical protein
LKITGFGIWVFECVYRMVIDFLCVVYKRYKFATGKKKLKHDVPCTVSIRVHNSYTRPTQDGSWGEGQFICNDNNKFIYCLLSIYLLELRTPTRQFYKLSCGINNNKKKDKTKSNL